MGANAEFGDAPATTAGNTPEPTTATAINLTELPRARLVTSKSVRLSGRRRRTHRRAPALLNGSSPVRMMDDLSTVSSARWLV